MKKLIYVALVLCIVCVAMADDHIIQFVVNGGQHVSFRTSNVTSITYDYHDQDSIDQAYQDSLDRDQFIRDSLAHEEFIRDSLYNDSVMKWNETHTLPQILDEYNNEYSLFFEALRRTGLVDSVARLHGDTLDAGPMYDNSGYQVYTPNERKVGYTLFAETDSVMRLNGINTFDDLVAYANNTYSSASEWHDYLQVNGLSVSTGNDYTNRTNALNMFVAYHILPIAMPSNWLVYERSIRNASIWNSAPDAEPYDYYETMLPHTLLKAWEPGASSGNPIYLNRYQTNNTLTNEVGTQGTNHEVVRKGAEVLRSKESVRASNGYVHPIGDMLVYDQLVATGVLHERMRFNCTSLIPELIANGLRSVYPNDVSALNGGGYGDRVGIPGNFSSNVVTYGQTKLYYNVHGMWRAWQSDQLQMWDYIDFAIKLPPVPKGVYELRIPYAPMARGGKIEYSLSTNPYAAFGTLDIFDATVDPMTDPSIGWTDALYEEDRGIASDKTMRERGYMRAPYSYARGGGWWSETYNCRYESAYGTMLLRKIVGRIQMDGQTQWLRIKVIDPDSYYSVISMLDYIELCPVSVCDNSTYMEDWY